MDALAGDHVLSANAWKEDKKDFFGWWEKQDLKHGKDKTDFFVYHYAGKVV